MSLQRAEDPGDRVAVAGAIYPLPTAAVRHQPRDISLTAASTLATVERTGPRRITDLAVTEGVTQPSMTALVTVLATAGLAERRADPRDQRVVLVALTAAGADYLRSRRRAGTEALARLIDKLRPTRSQPCWRPPRHCVTCMSSTTSSGLPATRSLPRQKNLLPDRPWR